MEPLKGYLGLSHADAELEKVVLWQPEVLCLGHNNLVHEKLVPLQAFLGLNAAELKKVVILIPAVLGYNHNNLVHEKLEPLQALLGLNAAELKKIVLLLCLQCFA
jgi:mTERF domain-containing protein